MRVEIERLGVRFKTFLSLRKDMVAIAKPMGFKGQLPVGTVMRMRVPGRKGRDLRLEIADPDYRLPNGRAFIVCPLPRNFAPKSPRQAERYSTTRFTNLELVLPSVHGQYRVLDLSMSGCRIDPGRERLETIWTPGETVAPAIVRVGSGIRIALEGVVPRLIQDGWVGLEFQFPKEGKTHDHLGKLVAWLDKQEAKQSRVIET